MKRPTQTDVARVAGVSRATVSYVLNGLANGRVPISEETRKRVLAAIEDLGYEPDARAQALRSGSTQTVGLILPDIRNPHFWQTADGVEQELRASDYHLLLSSADLNPEYGEDIFKVLSRRRIDGLILIGAHLFQSEGAQKILAQLLKRKIPCRENRRAPDDRLRGVQLPGSHTRSDGLFIVAATPADWLDLRRAAAVGRPGDR